MSEIYRDSTVALSLGVSGATNVAATITRDGNTVFTTTGPGITLPFSITGYDGYFTVDWAFQIDGVDQTRSETHQVVTPYYTAQDLRTDIPNLPAEISDADLVKAERRVRRSIEKICNQSFGKWTGTVKINGRGDDRLRLPNRLLSLDSFDGAYVLPSSYYTLYGDNWYLGVVSPSFGDGDMVFTPVIRDPSTAWRVPFREGVTYSITGTWGWDSIPEDVREAALILIEYELCPDRGYRDRYIVNVQYADSTFEFSPASFAGTGSVSADRLLSRYVRTFMTVI